MIDVTTKNIEVKGESKENISNRGFRIYRLKSSSGTEKETSSGVTMRG